jgi:hypothetical protein
MMVEHGGDRAVRVAVHADAHAPERGAHRRTRRGSTTAGLPTVVCVVCVIAVIAFAAMQPMFAGDRVPTRSPEQWREHLGELIDRWHHAASVGDGDVFFAMMSDDAVFLGTDPSERWAGAAFREFAQPYFDGTEAWTYVSESRWIDVERGLRPGVVWWDEVLRSEKYGPCRATGILVRVPDDPRRSRPNDPATWQIARYSLTFLVPNDIAGETTAMTLEHEAAQATEAVEGTGAASPEAGGGG